MDGYRATAFYLAVWYAFLTALGSVLLIVLNDVELAAGLLIAANLALLFALVLMASGGRLNDRRITRGSVLAHVAAADPSVRRSRPAHGVPRAGGDLAALRQRARQ